MNFFKLIVYSAVTIGMQNCYAMIVEKKPIDLHLINYTNEPILITFIDPERVSKFHTRQFTQDTAISEHKPYQLLNAKSPIARYMRTLKPNGILDIKGFMEHQKLTATLGKTELAISGDRLNKEFDKPGTAIITVRMQEIPGTWQTGYKSQKTLLSDIVRDKKTLEQLKTLEKEPAVKKAEEFGQRAEKEFMQIETEEQAHRRFDALKKERQEKANALGAWAKVMADIFNHDIAELTKADVYKRLGLPESASANELFNWKLIGETPMNAKKVAQKLTFVFHDIQIPSKLKEIGFARHIQDKATAVDRLILDETKNVR